MNLGKRLYELQQLDQRLEKSAEALARLEHQLAHYEPLEKAREALASLQAEHAELHQRQRAAEDEVEDIEAKLKPIQQKLLRVSGSTPKELAALEKQAVQLKALVTEKEDNVLEMMAQLEGLQSAATDKAAEVHRLEKEWAGSRTQLQAEHAEVKAAIEAHQRLKDEVAAQMDPAHLDLYQKLRQKKQGLAVARIEQGRCQGCKITIPVSELSQARAGDLVQCGSCSRVLCLL